MFPHVPPVKNLVYAPDNDDDYDDYDDYLLFVQIKLCLRFVSVQC